MDRRNFLKKLGIGAIGAASATVLVDAITESVKNIKEKPSENLKLGKGIWEQIQDKNIIKYNPSDMNNKREIRLYTNREGLEQFYKAMEKYPY